MDIGIGRIDRQTPLDIRRARLQRGFPIIPPSEARIRSIEKRTFLNPASRAEF
jgi:hypothetical protein